MIKIDNFSLYRVHSLLLGLFVVLVISSCEIDDFSEDISSTSNTAPTVTLNAPGDSVNVANEFTFSVTASDDSPGLSQAVFTVRDSLGIVIVSQTFELIGTSATAEMDFEVDGLPLGRHTLTVVVSDTEGESTTVTKEFIAFTEVLKFTETELFVLGSMNGWGGTDLQMTLVNNYTWEVKAVFISATDEFKFANTSDFSGTDWGDDGCDGVAASGEGNIGCIAADGFYDLRFNDQTFAYSFTEVPANVRNVYILGSMNGWGGTDLEMNLTGPNTWEISGVALAASDEFKFANTPDFSDMDWGDNECDGTADTPGAGNISNTNCGFGTGLFHVTFNDATLAYSITQIATQTEMYVLGSMNGWGGTDLQMTFVDNFTWQVSGVLISDTDEFKFVNTSDFSDVDWGDDDCDGVGDQGGANIRCDIGQGIYTITFNDQSLEYSLDGLNFNQSQMFVLGSMNGWGGTDFQMTLVDNNTWQVENVTMVDSDEFKFANTSDFSDLDWGDDGCDGLTTNGEGNIACGFAGTFTMTWNDETLQYSVQ